MRQQHVHNTHTHGWDGETESEREGGRERIEGKKEIRNLKIYYIFDSIAIYFIYGPQIEYDFLQFLGFIKCEQRACCVYQSVPYRIDKFNRFICCACEQHTHYVFSYWFTQPSRSHLIVCVHRIFTTISIYGKKQQYIAVDEGNSFSCDKLKIRNPFGKSSKLLNAFEDCVRTLSKICFRLSLDNEILSNGVLYSILFM